VPVVLLEGIDLVAIAVFLLLLAFLYSLKYTITPLLNVLHSALGWVPGVGKLVGDAENAIVGAIDSGITTVSKVAHDLWLGSLDATIYLVDALRSLGAAVEQHVRTLYDESLPAWARWALGESLLVIGVVAAPYPTVAAWIHGIAADLRAYARGRADAVAQAAADALTDATTTIYQDVLEATATTLTSAEAYADFQVQTVADELDAVRRDLAAAEGAVAGELPELPGLGYDALRDAFGRLDLERLAGLLGAGALTGYLVQALAREAGLADAECRGKVKQICATDAAAWENLLAGLVALGFAFSLRELYDVARPLVDELAPVIAQAA